MTNLRAKKAYGALFDEVSRILCETDPVCLIEIGAPKDEYTPEVRTILPRLTNARSVADAHQIVFEEFTRWFDDSAGPFERYAVVAKRVWEAWTKCGLAPQQPDNQ